MCALMPRAGPPQVQIFVLAASTQRTLGAQVPGESPFNVGRSILRDGQRMVTLPKDVESRKMVQVNLFVKQR